MRWHVIPRNRFFNIYLHKMLRDDDPRARHDHPWNNVSIVLKGGYLEWMSDFGNGPVDIAWRGPGAIVFRRATAAHRLTLGYRRRPSWSLFLTGPKVRDWGFLCPKGWVPWQKFCAEDPNLVGKGCDQ